MTTEQMDWLDDERAGRHKMLSEANGIRAWGMSGIPEIMFGDPSDEQLAAAQKHSGRNGVLIIPEGMRDYLFGNRIADAEPEFHCDVCGSELHDALAHQTEEAYWVERKAETVTMAEEPIENRLRRAWLNGFKDGVERAAYATVESTGRWDY